MFTLLVLVTSQRLVAEGRVAVGVAEREFVLGQISTQVAAARSTRQILIIGVSNSPYGKQLSDEFLSLTAQNPASSVGMVLVFLRELGLANERMEFTLDTDVEKVSQFEQLAAARNMVLLDFRIFPRLR